MTSPPLPTEKAKEGRQAPRYPVALRLQLGGADNQYEARSRKVSLRGFSVALPENPGAQTQPVTIHLPDQSLVKGQARLVNDLSSNLYGFELQLDVENLQAWAAFIETEAQRGGLWRLLGRYASGNADDAGSLGGVKQKSSMGGLLGKMGLSGLSGSATEPVLRLHMVGENLEAFRLAFEKFGGVVPEKSDLARMVPGFLEQAKRSVSRVLPGDVWLRLHDRAEVETFFIVELRRGGYAYVRVEAEKPVGLIGLSGAELIAIEMDGRPLFPFFEKDDLERIAFDTFRRAQVESLPVVQGVVLEETAPNYQHQALDTGVEARQVSLEELAKVVSVASRVDTRFYGGKVIRLYPEVYLRLSRDGESHTGFGLQDGANLCVFALRGTNTPRVIRITDEDLVGVLSSRPADWKPGETP